MVSRVLVRAEKDSDQEAIRAIHAAAFATPTEATIVDTLRQQAQPIVSLVAEESGEIVGHIMFSPVSLSGNQDRKLMGLGPMAVAPAHQRKGFGSALVRVGLDHCRHLGYSAVVVLGHPQFYPRFGFSPASRFGLDCEYDVPEGVFMALELKPDGLSEVAGTVKYHSAFGGA
jgi:putative acetyltransferase